MPVRDGGAAAQADIVSVLMEASPIAMLMADREGRILLVNTQAERIFGYTRDELLTLVVEDLVPDRLRRRHPQLRSSFSARPEPRPMGAGRDLFGRRKSGQEVPIEIGLSPLVIGGEDRVVAAIIDITARKGLEERLREEADSRMRYMATHDALTGLPDRALFVEQVDRLIADRGAVGEAVGVGLISIGGVGRVNEALGRRAGDDFLAEAAHRLIQLARDDADDLLVSRISANEFAVAARAPLPLPIPNPRVRAILDVMSAPIQIQGQWLQTNIGSGVAVYPMDGSEAGQLLQEAEIAMRRAQVSGAREVVRFEESMIEQTRQRLELEAALPEAIARGELSLVFQPQVALDSGRTINVETLVRWEHEGVTVSPADFIPIAEESDLILEIGEWTLREACRQIASLPEAYADLRVAVNVSPRQFLATPVVALVERALAESGLAPERLELEVTEGMLMSDPQRSAELLAGLRDLGVAIAIDDFGTGYSSLAYLTRFRFDTLKIDQSFVHRLLDDRADRAIVDAVIAMTRALHITVLAEGIETREQADYLRAAGCDLGQGFLYSRGIPLGELPDFLGNLPG